MQPNNKPAAGLAFYDFDGTLVSGNVVHQYFWYAWEAWSIRRIIALAQQAQALREADARSRAEFNRVFYAHYRGFRRDWLTATAERVWTRRLRRKLIDSVVTRFCSWE